MFWRVCAVENRLLCSILYNALESIDEIQIRLVRNIGFVLKCRN